MYIPLEKLNALFQPHDIQHLLLVWFILTAFLSIGALIMGSAGIYLSGTRLWNVLLKVLAGAYLLSGVCFLLFRLNAIFIIMALVCMAFVMLGDVGVDEPGAPLVEWWIALLSAKRRAREEGDESSRERN
jgi:hypothetical protein